MGIGPAQAERSASRATRASCAAKRPRRRSRSTTSRMSTRRPESMDSCAATPHATARIESAMLTSGAAAPRPAAEMMRCSSTKVEPWWSPAATRRGSGCSAKVRTRPLVYSTGGGRAERHARLRRSSARVATRTFTSVGSTALSPWEGMKASSLPPSPTMLTSNWFAEASANMQISRQARAPESKSTSTYAWSITSGRAGPGRPGRE
mmetsp:Transcript_1226/g.3913  ORF Transcript_1226/g.3913 Transcript_1226/m.3913 type:complete len:207 (+) Transcript_1226:192-812(+)